MKLDQKKINIVLTAVLVVSLVIGLGAMFLTRTQERQPTPEEIALVGAYGAGESQTKTALLALCESLGSQTVNGTAYEAYASDTLPDLLYEVVTLNQVLLSADGILYISYTAQGDLEVMLAYDDTGCVEKTVYDVSRDIMYHETAGTLRVYEHFSSSLAG